MTGSAERVTDCTTASGTRVDARWYIDASGTARVLSRAMGIPIVAYGRQKVCLWTYFDTPSLHDGTAFFVGNRDAYLSWVWDIPISPGDRGVHAGEGTRLMRQTLLAIRGRLEHVPLSIVQLAMRIGVGAVFFKAGLLKYNSWEFTVLLFRDEYKVPVLDPVTAAQMAMVQELTIPVLLFLGLATRVATVPLLGMIGVIQTFVYPNAWTEHLVWASILVFLLTRGPGAFSLDHLIARRFMAAGSAAAGTRTRASLGRSEAS